MESPAPIIGSSGGPEPEERTRVFILAEARFYREGLARFLSRQPGFEVVGTAEHAAEAVDLARRLRFDVVLLDMAMSAEIDAARMLTAVAPAAGIVALGVGEDEREVVSLAEAGVSGFVARDASLEEVSRAVASAATGETWCSLRVAAILAHRVSIIAGAAAGRARCDPADAQAGRDRAAHWRGAAQQDDRAAAVHRDADGQEPRAQHP